MIADALASVDQLDADWCTAALASTLGAARVVDCAATPIGDGQIADTLRLDLRFDPPDAGPASAVAKVTARAPGSRTAARVNRCYETEVGFYRDVAPTVAARVPRCHHAVHDPVTGAYTVLLEDVRTARAGNQLAGCSTDEAAAAVEQLALLHAPRWGDPTLDELPWMVRHDGETATRTAELAALVVPRFLRCHGDALAPEVVALIGRFPPLVAAYLADRPGPRTMVHGDFRADNLLFGAEGITVVDWQTVAKEPGVTDLSYLLGASLPTAVRRQDERPLVELYAGALAASGVAVTAEELWAGYRRYALGGLLVCVVAAVLVPRSPRGDELFVAMAERHGWHALDLGAEELVG